MILLGSLRVLAVAAAFATEVVILIRRIRQLKQNIGSVRTLQRLSRRGSHNRCASDDV
jgi:hypothetical protein